ncbi:MAG: DUF4406 domain-containing protein [Nitrosarchaeum sp.]|nr:DUF4406 domain-containing protein [Nitrosarchaeum sp.]
MIVVYIASPYTLGDVAVNVKTQLDVADKLMTLDFCPVVPLFTHFQQLHKPRPYQDWMKIDFEKIKRSDIVLRLKGKSKGADKEVALAKSLRIPVVYSIDELIKVSNKIRRK